MVRKGRPKGRGPVLVLGGGSSLWDDVDALEELIGVPWPGVVIAVNDAGYKKSTTGRIWDRPLHHWATLHAEKMAGWKGQREAAGLPGGFQTWSSVRRQVIQNHFSGITNGSSGLYGVTVGLMALRHDRAIACGIPMDASPNTFSGRDWRAHSRYRRGWTQAEAQLMGRVKSMSGWTRKVFGAPTREWIGLVPFIPV
jgi:hypothetical protein